MSDGGSGMVLHSLAMRGNHLISSR